MALFTPETDSDSGTKECDTVFKNLLSVKEFDIDGVFCRFLTCSINEPQDLNHMTAEQADEDIKRKAWGQNEDVAKAFLTFDRDGNGIVSKKELRKVLYKYQIPLNKEEFTKLWNKYVNSSA